MNVPDDVRGIMQIGSNYGVVLLDVICECCHGFDTRTYFFTMDEGDHVRTKWLKPRAIDSDVVVMLPGAKGRFAPQLTSVTGFDDSYILRILVHSMPADDDSSNKTIDLVFTRVHHRILLRTAFRNLYFRAFRRAFAPDQPQGIRSILQYGEDFA